MEATSAILLDIGNRHLEKDSHTAIVQVAYLVSEPVIGVPVHVSGSFSKGNIERFDSNIERFDIWTEIPAELPSFIACIQPLRLPGGLIVKPKALAAIEPPISQIELHVPFAA